MRSSAARNNSTDSLGNWHCDGASRTAQSHSLYFSDSAARFWFCWTQLYPEAHQPLSAEEHRWCSEVNAMIVKALSDLSGLKSFRLLINYTISMWTEPTRARATGWTWNIWNLLSGLDLASLNAFLVGFLKASCLSKWSALRYSKEHWHQQRSMKDEEVYLI